MTHRPNKHTVVYEPAPKHPKCAGWYAWDGEAGESGAAAPEGEVTRLVAAELVSRLAVAGERAPGGPAPATGPARPRAS